MGTTASLSFSLLAMTKTCLGPHRRQTHGLYRNPQTASAYLLLAVATFRTRWFTASKPVAHSAFKHLAIDNTSLKLTAKREKSLQTSACHSYTTCQRHIVAQHAAKGPCAAAATPAGTHYYIPAMQRKYVSTCSHTARGERKVKQQPLHFKALSHPNQKPSTGL